MWALSSWLIVFLIAAVFLVGCRALRHGYESAPYRVILTDGKFEVRDYPAFKIAETSMREGSHASFNRLFHFITGGNQYKRTIAMTTPVFMTGSKMAFVMPSDLKDVPMPNDALVGVKTMSAGRFAVLQFSGKRSWVQEERQLAKLKQWMSGRGLPVLSEPIYGYFDPPWIPTFFRRNEVMLRTVD